MVRFKQMLSRYKYGLRALSSLMLVLIVAIALNVFASEMESRYGLRSDLSANQFTSLSDTTKSALDTLKDNVHIYLIYQPGTKNELRVTLETMLEKYCVQSSKLQVETIDPLTQPGRILPFTQDSASVTEGSIIVTNDAETRSRVIVSGEMFNYRADASGSGYEVSSFLGENKLTSAILYVTAENSPRVFFLTGHDEVASSYCTVVQGQLRSNNYEVSDLTPDGYDSLRAGDTLVVIAPTVDLTDEEYRQLQLWLDAGGRLLYVNDPMAGQERLTNFKRLLSYYNLGFEEGMVVENPTQTDRYLSSPAYLVPMIQNDSVIASGLEGGRMLLPQTSAVQMPKMPLAGHIYESLITSSDQSYLKAIDDSEDILTQAPEDPQGPFTLAVSMLRENDPNDPTLDTRLILIGTPYVMVDSNYLNSSYNMNFTMHSLEWLVNRETGISIFARPIADTSLILPDASVFWRLAALVAVAVPALFFVTGMIIWMKRRRM